MPGAHTHPAPPKDFAFDRFTNDRGQSIRYGHMPARTANSIGTLVLGPGYGEPIDKYFELVGDLAKQGYDIYIIDWMGQGGSDRINPADRHKPYDVKGFIEHHRDDLHHLATKIVKAPDDHKIGYMGFSMGAHIGLRFLERYNYVFDMASMNASFLDINSGGIPRPLVPTVAKSLKMAGKGKDYVGSGGPWSSLKYQFNQNRKTSDPGRFRRMIELFENKSDLQLGDVTVDWVHHVLPAIKYLNNVKTLRQIITPVQLSISGQDKTVSLPAQKRALEHLPNAQGRIYRTARHEIWIEEDAIRNRWLKEVTHFFRSVIKADMKPVRFDRMLLQRQKNISYR